MKVTESDYRLAKLIRFLCIGELKDGDYSGSQTKGNPYCVSAIKDNLKYLGAKYGYDYLDAAELVMAQYEKEN